MTQPSAAQIEAGYGKQNSWWKKPWLWIGVVVVVGAAGGTAYVVHRAGQHGMQGGDRVTYATVQKGDIAQTVDISGTLNPSNEQTITGDTSNLLSVYVKAGDKVKKGQLIAKLDPSSYQIQLEAANAQLAAAQAKLSQSEESTTTVGSHGQTQTTAPDPNVVAENQASVDEAQAQVNQIQAEIDACTITSPINGTVLQVANPNQNSASVTSSSGSSGSGSGSGTASSGQTSQSSANSTIAVIANLSTTQFEVDANVPQTEMASIQDGQSSTISITAGGTGTLTGKVESISYTPQTQSGVTTYPVVIQVTNSSGSGTPTTLLPGESASVVVDVKDDKNVLMVPSDAITQQRGTVGVYVPAQGGSQGVSQGGSQAATASGSSADGQSVLKGLTFVPVTVGIDNGRMVEIKSGLSAGQTVAVVIPAYSSNTSATGSGKTSSAGGGSTSMFGGMGRQFGLGASGYGSASGGSVGSGGGYRGQGGGGYAGGGSGFSGGSAGGGYAGGGK